jgi:hypothetical protein
VAVIVHKDELTHFLEMGRTGLVIGLWLIEHSTGGFIKTGFA